MGGGIDRKYPLWGRCLATPQRTLTGPKTTHGKHYYPAIQIQSNGPVVIVPGQHPDSRVLWDHVQQGHALTGKKRPPGGERGPGAGRGPHGRPTELLYGVRHTRFRHIFFTTFWLGLLDHEPAFLEVGHHNISNSLYNDDVLEMYLPVKNYSACYRLHVHACGHRDWMDRFGNIDHSIATLVTLF